MCVHLGGVQMCFGFAFHRKLHHGDHDVRDLHDIRDDRDVLDIRDDNDARTFP
jgi:hypothetical protein